MHKAKKLLHKWYIHMQFLFRLGKVENMTISEAKRLIDDYYCQTPLYMNI